jgi:hypothetical protein
LCRHPGHPTAGADAHGLVVAVDRRATLARGELIEVTRTTTVAPVADIPPLSQAIACSQMSANASAWIITTERRLASDVGK